MQFTRENALDLMVVSGITREDAEELWDRGPRAILFYYQNRPHLVVSEWLITELVAWRQRAEENRH